VFSKQDKNNFRSMGMMSVLEFNTVHLSKVASREFVRFDVNTPEGISFLVSDASGKMKSGNVYRLSTSFSQN
jgi:hypothetical protein